MNLRRRVTNIKPVRAISNRASAACPSDGTMRVERSTTPVMVPTFPYFPIACFSLIPFFLDPSPWQVRILPGAPRFLSVQFLLCFTLRKIVHDRRSNRMTSPAIEIAGIDAGMETDPLEADTVMSVAVSSDSVTN